MAQSVTNSRGCFNTLAQSETAHLQKPVLIVNGNGAELSDSNGLKRKAKRKVITQSVVISMIDIEKENGNTEMEKSLWNTYHCQNKIHSANGKIYGKYCKNRFCTLCSSIRKASLINKYLPIVKTWEKPYFVTLTARAISLKSLKRRMSDMNRGFRLISSKLRKQHQRGKGIKLVGLKSLECNFNPTAKTYNPHLHLLVANKEMAELLIKEWLLKCANHNGKNWAEKWAQNMKPVNNTESALIEIIKYSSKIFTDPTENKKNKENKNNTTTQQEIYVKAYGNILKSMQGLRIFDRFGFNVSKENDSNEVNSKVVKDYEEWVFDAKQFDWINTANDKTLTNYIPTPQLLEILHYRSNSNAE